MPSTYTAADQRIRLVVELVCFVVCFCELPWVAYGATWVVWGIVAMAGGIVNGYVLLRRGVGLINMLWVGAGLGLLLAYSLSLFSEFWRGSWGEWWHYLRLFLREQ